jgi:hypothetical protein
MAKYQFTDIERMAIWKAHKGRCAYCGEPTPFKDLHIDHILPESLLNNTDKLEKIKTEYGLGSVFEINSYYNWIPSCSKCNRTKSNKVYSKPGTFYFLEMVAKPKYEEISRIEQSLQKTLKKEGYLTRSEATQVIEEYIKDLIVNNLIMSPATKRRDRWIDEYLSKAYQLITEKVAFSVVENLPNNELFITVVLQATSIALRNHQGEKLEALTNAIINSVLPNAPDESLQLMFLNFIDSFTPCHLIMIDFIDNPTDWCRKNNIIISELMNRFRYNDIGQYMNHFDFLEEILPEIKNNRYIYEQALEDITAKGLLISSDGGQKVSGVGIHILDLHKSAVSLSNTGKQFIDFIVRKLD